MPAEIPDGAVIVARAIMNSSLWTMRLEDRIVALTCIVLCNHRPKKWFDGSKTIVIKRGQFVRAIRDLAKAANLSLKSTRTSVQHLENSEFLARNPAQRYTLWEVPKYDFYQNLANYSDSAGTTSGTIRAQGGHDAGTKQVLDELNKKRRGASSTPPHPLSKGQKKGRWDHLDKLAKASERARFAGS